MFNLKEYLDRPKKLSHRLPWALFIAPGIILNKTGSLQATIRYRGPDLYSSTKEELAVVAAQINNALKRLGSGWAYFIESQRRKTYDYPESIWPNKACELIDAERKKMFLSEGNYFISTYYFTFSYMPPSDKVNSISSRFINESQPKINYDRYLDYFQEEMKKIVDILARIFPVVEILDDDNTLTYLHSCVSTKCHPVKKPSIPIFLDYILTDQLLEAGLHPKLGEDYIKVISINGFPQESYPQIFYELDSLACEYRWMTRFICLDKMTARKELKKYSKQWFAKRKSLWSLIKEVSLNRIDEGREDNDAIIKSEGCEVTADVVASNNVSAGYYTSCIVLWDKNKDNLREKIADVEQVINSAGFVTINETFNCIQAWLGSLPGHCWANIRRPLMTSLHLTHLMPVSTDWAGPEKNNHLNGPPLFQAKTKGNTPFRFSNHIVDVGHTMIVGPTGTGKSVLLSFIAANFLRYSNARVYFFDKDYSAKCITLAMQGKHYDLGENIKISFQPLRNIDKELERSWAVEWLCGLLIQDNTTITPLIKNELWEALTNLGSSPENQRTITGLVALLQNKKLRQALQSYTIAGPFGYLLDANEDFITDSHWQCFEMNHLMSFTPGAVLPVLTYLFHMLEQGFDGNPGLLILDEAWHFLLHPVFARQINDWLKTLRKKNVSVIFATQSLADVTNNSIISTLIEACPTRIFLANRKAFETYVYEQYKQFGLNDKQIEIIATALPKCEYYCQSDIGNRKFELGLGPVSLALCGSSSQGDLSLIDEIRKEDKTIFTEKLLKMKGVDYE